MIYVVGLISGFINGIFASGAGQIVVFSLIYILKVETHKSRATSIFCLLIVTIFTLIRYSKFSKFEMLNVIITIIIGCIFGVIGTKIMKKIPSNYLNVFSGLIVTGLALYNLIKG